ncbi:NUDIX domain-containing protein [Deinococcus ruber]|nr:NUDIX domain-containing protein [Deinococcus ruber]
MSSSADPTFHLVSWLILRRSDGRILLGRRAGVSYGEGCWGLPGGHVLDTETLAQAAARETLEEVGLTVNAADLTPLGMVRYVDAGVRGADFFFLAERWEGEPYPVSECSEVGWFEPDQLPADALPWLADTLRRQLSGEEPWLSESVEGI